MSRRVRYILLAPLLLFGLYSLTRHLQHKKEEQRRATYYENLTDSASPTVQVLRDSIPIDYQGTRRTIHVYIPPDYHNDSLQTYPVIYLLDGESAFNDLENDAPEWQVDEVIDACAARGEQTAIVIAINQAENRDAEYTPYVNEDNPGAHGEAFASWLATDLKDWVDTHYRTRPESPYTFIGGISRSGMMAYYMLMAHPDIFGGALIQSPAMWVDHDRLLAMELPPHHVDRKKIYVSVGQKEGRVMIPHARDVYQKFKDMGFSHDQLRLEIIPEEGHWHVTWRKSFALAYPWIVL